MIKYDKFKETNFEWLGEIPDEWMVIRIKDFTYLKARIGWQGMRSDEFTENTDWFCVTGTDFKDGKIDWENCYCIDEYRYLQDTKIQLELNDLLITKDGTIGKIALVNSLPQKATLNSGVFVTRPKNNMYSNQFMFWLLSSNVFTRFIDFNKNGSTILHLYQNVFERFFYCLPTKSEQTQIANYLDTKTQALDKKINLLSQKANYYKEYRKSLINEAVCKGLEKNVKLKDSGIEWLDKIPNSWDVRRVKDCFKIFTGNSISDKSLHEVKTSSIDYVATKDIDIETGNINYSNGVYIQITDSSFKIAKANSTLICIEGASAGKKIGFTNKDVCFVNKLCAIKSLNAQNLDKYFFYFTQSELFEKQFFSILNGLIGGVSLSLIKHFNIILPEAIEQTEIANYLDQKTQTIDKVVGNINKQIETLKELRKTLINDTVTGKIKVTTN